MFFIAHIPAMYTKKSEQPPKQCSDLVPLTGLEPVRCKPARDFKSLASANSATAANQLI